MSESNGRSIVAIIFCLFYVTYGQFTDNLVQTKLGSIKGVSADDGSYSMFLGIPYAVVDPLNPFGPSIPHAGFKHTYSAVDDSIICPQKKVFYNTIEGTLDCLRLNVYVPNAANTENHLPVMVYIHGGGFVDGYGGRFLHDPKFIVKHDVIVVTLNYRLGPYGFLCLDIPEVPGNQGLKDQLTALRWVKNNIEAFRGDSNKITVFGESAGAASVDFHLTYTKEDLFNKVIIQSGTTLAPFTNPKADLNAPIVLAKHLGLAPNKVRDALDSLRTVNTSLVIAASLETKVLIRPCVEKKFNNVERFVTDHPVQMQVLKAKTVPILIGFNNNERGDVFEKLSPKQFQNINPFTELDEIFNFDNDEYRTSMLNIVKQFYIGDAAINKNVKKQLADFVSDFAFLYPTYRSIEKYFENGATTIYHYVFSYDGGRNFIKRKDNITTISGALHSDELSYLFNVGMMKESVAPEDHLTVDRITTLWTNFAKYGNPTPEITDRLPVQWPVITSRYMYYLDLNAKVSIKKRPFHERMAFWKIFFQLNKRFIKS